MTNTLFVTANEPSSGKTAICLGLVHSLSRLVQRVGFLKPITRPSQDGRVDRDMDLFREVYHLHTLSESTGIMEIGEVREAISKGQQEEVIQRIEDVYDRFAEGKDVVIVEGTDLSDVMSVTDMSSVFDVDVGLAEQLGARVLLVVNGGAEKSVQDVITDVVMSKNYMCTDYHCEFLGVIINKVDQDKYDDVNTYVRRELRRQDVEVFGVVPFHPVLSSPQIAEIAEKINAKVIYGREYLSNIALHTIVAAMNVRNMLNYVEDNTLVITPGDRDDVLLAAAAMSISTAYPTIAGLVLTGGLYPHDNIRRLVEGMPGVRIPVLVVNEDTYTITSKIDDIAVTIRSDDERKIKLIQEMVEDHIDERRVYNRLRIQATRRRQVPHDFLDSLIARARGERKHMVFPEGDEERTLQAAARLLERGIVDVTLLGDPDRIPLHAREIGVDLSNARIINPMNTDVETYAQAYYEIRKHKNISIEQARDQVEDPIYYGTMMVHMGDADGLVSGAIHSTGNTIRPAFQIIKTKPGISVASSVFIMCLEDRVFLYGDCAIVTEPTAEQLADIALMSVETALMLGIEPYVAMLSYATGDSAGGESVEKVRQATELARQKNPDLILEGPIQFDAAYDAGVARIKSPKSKVAGKTTVYIFPDLNAGNIAYKAVQRSAGAIAIGPILQGLNKPVNDLSRGCVVDDIIYVTAITAIQAQQTGR